MQISLHSAAPKSAEILHSLRSIFAEKGFDGASMQDLARAAGMSAGNFYRYFPSKAAIIEALISHDMKLMAQDFESALLSGDPMAEIRSQIRSRIHLHQCTLDGCLWAEINAVALRKPEIAEIIAKMEATVTDYLVKVYATRTGTTSDPAQKFRRQLVQIAQDRIPFEQRKDTGYRSNHRHHRKDAGRSVQWHQERLPCARPFFLAS